VTVAAPPSPTIAKSTTSLNFGTALTNATFQIWNGGSGSINYSLEIDSGGSYFSLTPPVTGSSTGSADKKTHTVTVNRGGMSEGQTVTGRIKITSNEANNTPQYISLSASKPTTPPPPPPQYTLTAQVSGGNGTVSGSGTYASGTTVTLTASPAGGYKVKKWTGTNNDSSAANTNTVTMSTNKTVTVEFEQITVVFYNLTTSVTGGSGTIKPTSGTYTSGTVVTLTASPASGYKVKKWTGTENDSSTGNSNTVKMNANKTVTVEFEQIPVVVTYALTASVSGGGGTVSPASGTYNEGTVVTLTASPAAGYQVSKWTGTNDDSSTSNTNTVTMNAKKTVTVAFVKKKYTLTTSVSGGSGSISPESGGSYDHGSVVTLTAQPAACYHVKKWTGTSNDTSTELSNTVTMTANRTVSVEFAIDRYELAVHVNGGHGSVTANPAGTEHDCGTTVQLTAVPETDYRVKSWTGTVNDASKSLQNSVVMNGDQAVTVEFEVIPPGPFSLIYQQVGGGVPPSQPSVTEYEAGEVVPLSVQPPEGYRVLAWQGTDDDTSRLSANTVTMNADKEVTVELASDLTALKCKVKAEKIAKQGTIQMTGSFTATAEEAATATGIDITIEAMDTQVVYGETIPYDPASLKKGKFSYKRKVGKGEPGAIKAFQFNLTKGTFSLTATRIELAAGLHSPFAAVIRFGDYAGMAEAGEEVINGKKPIPLRLLQGFEDTLQADKAQLKLGTGKKEGKDALLVQGGITTASLEPALDAQEWTIFWGKDQSFVIPAWNLVQVKGAKYLCKKYQDSQGWVVSGLIDLDKCVYKIVIKDADIGVAESPAEFGMQFGAFDETVSLPLTQKSETVQVYP